MDKEKLEQAQAEMRASFKKKVNRGRPVKKKETIKQEVSVSIPEEIKENMTHEQVKTVSRHVIGITRLLNDLGVLKPKCRVCFDELGWLSHCRCVKST